MTLKNKIKNLKNLIEMRQMTLNDPKFDIKKSLDSLACMSFTYSTKQSIKNSLIMLT